MGTWALVLLLGLGAALGTAVGIAGSRSTSTTAATDLTGPAAQHWLSGVLAATKAAGTAHLDSTMGTTSPTPDLRASDSGSGVVNFATGDFHFTDTEHRIAWTSQNGGPAHAQAQTTAFGQIAVGRSLYDDFLLPGLAGNWTKQPFPRDTGELGLGSTDEVNAVLAPLSEPFTAVAVNDLGTTVVNGVPATRYLVDSEAEPSTAAVCTTSAHRHRTLQRGRATVWVDGQGRLVQARVINSERVPATLAKEDPSLGDAPRGPFTVTSTLHFSRWGAPVRIAVPTPSSGHGVAVVSTGYGSAVFCG